MCVPVSGEHPQHDLTTTHGTTPHADTTSSPGLHTHTSWDNGTIHYDAATDNSGSPETPSLAQPEPQPAAKDNTRPASHAHGHADPARLLPLPAAQGHQVSHTAGSQAQDVTKSLRALSAEQCTARQPDGSALQLAQHAADPAARGLRPRTGPRLTQNPALFEPKRRAEQEAKVETPAAIVASGTGRSLAWHKNR